MSDQDATMTLTSNVGLEAISDRRDTATVFTLNVGVELPPLVDVVHPQIGWGVPVTPETTTRVLLADSAAVAQTYEEVT